MGKGVAALALALIALGSSTATAASPISATATLSSRLHGASNVVLTVRFDSVLECGQLQTPSIQVRLPHDMHVPTRIPRTAVLVAGQHPASVHVTGTVITLALPHAGVTCFVMKLGAVTIRLERGAGLGNPAGKGAYDFTVVAGTRIWLGSFAIK